MCEHIQSFNKIMATGDSCEELTSLTCQICFGRFPWRNMRKLSCLHTFCEYCLQHLQTDVGAEICCPMCKQRTELPGGSVATLPQPFHFSYVDTDKKWHKVCEMSAGCCTDCCVLCDQPFPYKLLTPLSLTLNDDSIYEKLACTLKSSRMASCPLCHEVNCLVYNEKHFQGNIKKILRSSLKSSEETLENLTMLETKISEDIKKAKNKMADYNNYLWQQINDQYKSLCLTLNQKEIDIKSNLFRLKTNAQNAKAYITRLLKLLESWHEPSQSITEAVMVDIGELIADVKQLMQGTDLEIRPQTIKFFEGTDEVRFGEVLEQALESPDGAVSSSAEGQIVETVQGLDITSNRIGVKPTLMWHVEKAAMSVEYLDDGKLVICMDDGLCVYDDNGSRVDDHYLSDVFKPDQGGELWNISASRRVNKIVITENREADDTGYLHAYEQEGDTLQYQRCDVCQEPEFVGVTSCGDCVVYSGEWELYRYGSNCQQVWCVDMSDIVYDLFIDDNDKIYVCHDDNVVVYGIDGQRVSSLSKTDRAIEPCGVCVDKSGQIFVCDRKKNSILLFDANYQFIKYLIDLNFTPSKISLYKNKRLSVCGQGRVYVYKL